MPSSSHRSAPSRILFPAVALAVVVVDQITKYAVKLLIPSSASIPVIPRVFHLTRVSNAGAAFGLLPGGRLLFFAATGIVIGFIITYYLRARPSSRLLLLALGLELGGALGNLIDRSLAGVVTDFLDFRIWPVFNVADSSLVVGVALLALVVLAHEWQERRQAEESS